MEKILDQLLMPPPSSSLQLGISHYNSQESPREFVGLNLDRSHNSSSTTNSSNSSWLSESSCGCHSPRTNQNKSSLIFYRRSILPPMLCSAARSEMQIYKNKAIEKEQKLRIKSKRNLLSKVEAILSSVEIESDTTKEIPPNLENENNVEDPVKCIDKFEITDDSKDNTSMSSDHSEPIEQNDFDVKQDSSPQSDSAEKKPQDQSSNSSFTHSSGEEEQSFQEEVYRKSLQNLLQKSMTESLNNSQILDVSKPTNKATSSESSSTETWAETTLATVVHNDECSASVATDHDDDQSETTTTASYLVDSILDEVRTELLSTSLIPIRTHSTESSLSEHSSHKSCELARSAAVLTQVATNEQKIPENKILNQNKPIKPERNGSKLAELSAGNKQEKPADGHKLQLQGQSTVKSSATDRINDALTLINTKLTCVSPRNGSLSEHSYDVTLGSICDQSATSVTPETNNLVGSYKNVLEKMENEHSHEEPLHESHEDLTSDELQNSTERNEEKEQSGRSRVRSNSYCIEAPSPLLVSSRDSHTIHSIQGDTDSCSETISLVSHDVKRRLEMHSDSEESFASVRNRGYDLMSRDSDSKNKDWDSSNNNTKYSDNQLSHEHYQTIEEQHKKELMELQLQHEKQLLLLKQQLVQTQPSLASSIETIGNMSFNDLKMNKSAETKVMDEVMHKKWCKLSALIKGYLTRRLLTSRPVQNIMQTIRDTSRTILSIKNEGNPNTRNEATLMERLFLQLEAALYEFHETFFDKSIQERIAIIARSQLAESREKNRLRSESSTVIPQQRLSAATLKSMERKRLEKKSQSAATKPPQKNVKSKISYIWKDDEAKNKVTQQRQTQNLDRKKSLKNSVSGRPLLNKNILASYSMSPIVR